MSGKILLKGNFQNSGFGFSCLRKADALKVNGKFEYLDSNNVLIQLSGEESAIEKFHSWCISQDTTYSGELSMLTELIIYNEFQIINQL